jgi:hypothetical protein
MTFLAMLSGNVREAVEILETARGLTADGSSLVVRSWIAAVLAESQSLAGNERACLALLDEAEAYTRQAPIDDPAADLFDSARLDGYRGACLLRFSRADEAHRILERALGSLVPGCGGSGPTYSPTTRSHCCGSEPWTRVASGR